MPEPPISQPGQSAPNMQPGIPGPAPVAEQVPVSQQPYAPQQAPAPLQAPAPQQMPLGTLAFPTGQHNKVHHSYIWLSPLLGIGAVIVISLISNINDIITGIMYARETGFPILLVLLFVLLGFVLLYGIFVGVTALSYKNLSFVFDETEFSLYSGIITKRRVHVPYARVQSVNHKQSLVQRIAGVCTVEIDTAGGASNKAIKVPYVKLGVGEAIRKELFVRKALSLGLQASPASVVGEGGVAVPLAGGAGGAAVPLAGSSAAAMAGQQGAGAGQANILDTTAQELGAEQFRGLYGENIVGMEPVSFERRMDNKELLLASISTSGMSGMLASMVILIVAGLVTVALFAREVLPLAALGVPFIVLWFAFICFVMVATTALSYGSFSVRRRGSRIEVERGILQRDFSGIDINRIQSVVIKQSIIRRMLGYCEVSLGRIRAGGGEDQNTQASLNSGGLVVHPFLKIDQVDSLMAGLLPEFSDRPKSSDFKGLPPVALRRGILRRCLWQNGFFWTILIIVVMQIAFNMFLPNIASSLNAEELRSLSFVNAACVLAYVFFTIQAGIIVLGTLWWKRGSGFALTHGYAAICNDGLGTETVYYPRQKIQDMMTRTNPFQKRAHTTTITALTAAGVGGTRNVLWDVREEDGLAWLDWLKPRTNVVE